MRGTFCFWAAAVIAVGLSACDDGGDDGDDGGSMGGAVSGGTSAMGGDPSGGTPSAGGEPAMGGRPISVARLIRFNFPVDWAGPEVQDIVRTSKHIQNLKPVQNHCDEARTPVNALKHNGVNIYCNHKMNTQAKNSLKRKLFKNRNPQKLEFFENQNASQTFK